MARPTKYNDKLARRICGRLARGESIRSICRNDDFPSATTVFNWLLDKDKQEFLEYYELARNEQAENLFDEILTIADFGSYKDVQRARLRIDARKWYLSKVLPKKYGDKLDVMSGGKPLKANTIVLKDFKQNEANSK